MNKLLTVRALTELIDYYKDNNSTFREYFTLNPNTPIETTPYDLFKAYYQNQALYTNDKSSLYARFNLLFKENEYIFKQIEQKINKINILLSEDAYNNISEDLNTGLNTTISNQNSTNKQIQQDTSKQNNISSDDNSYNGEINAQNLETLNANVQSQAFTINDFNQTNTNSLETSNIVNASNKTIRVSKNTAKNILALMNIEALNFREKFIRAFSSLFVNVKAEKDSDNLVYNDVFISKYSFNEKIKELENEIQNKLNVIDKKLNTNIEQDAEQEKKIQLLNEFKELLTNKVNVLEAFKSEMLLFKGQITNELSEEIARVIKLLETYKEYVNNNFVKNATFSEENEKLKTLIIQDINSKIEQIQNQLTTINQNLANTYNKQEIENKLTTINQAIQKLAGLDPELKNKVKANEEQIFTLSEKLDYIDRDVKTLNTVKKELSKVKSDLERHQNWLMEISPITTRNEAAIKEIFQKFKNLSVDYKWELVKQERATNITEGKTLTTLSIDTNDTLCVYLGVQFINGKTYTYQFFQNQIDDIDYKNTFIAMFNWSKNWSEDNTANYPDLLHILISDGSVKYKGSTSVQWGRTAIKGSDIQHIDVKVYKLKIQLNEIVYT
ncbi:hypothetical protein [Mycoplasmopsis bovis]|uniref:hypothetical protein n=1 Tax=Mycoplasmopsis bovis TaxID=28903 RepID=UPI00094B1781|nr:hypothetical protein [Mycoplasmopsis bovis]